MSAKNPAKTAPVEAETEAAPEATANKPNAAHRKRIADLVLLDGNGDHLLLAVDQGKDGQGVYHLITIHPVTGDRYRVAIIVLPVKPLEAMHLPPITIRQGEIPAKPKS